MKEILFRGKSIVADSPNTPGHWLEGCYINRIFECEGCTVNEHHIISRSHYINIYLDSDTEVWSETVGQYTGLKDRDGRRIFEGDIVRCCGEIRSVIYDEKFAEFELSGSDGLSLCCDSQLCKIIGNIHDNPEMMEGESEWKRSM